MSILNIGVYTLIACMVCLVVLLIRLGMLGRKDVLTESGEQSMELIGAVTFTLWVISVIVISVGLMEL